jgi:hypothetical protein
MGNISNTRFPNGLTNVSEVNLFADMVQPDQTLFHEYWNDFNSYASADWTVTATGSTTQALTAGDGGLLLITNSAANNDVCQVQKLPAAFAFTAGKKAFFRAKFQVNDATASTVIVGVQNTNTVATTATDGIYFSKAASSTSVSLISRLNTTTGSTTVTGVATMANATQIELGWYWDGVSVLAYEVNGTVLGSINPSTGYIPDTTVAPIFYIKNGAAAAKTMTVDYVFFAIER